MSARRATAVAIGILLVIGLVGFLRGPKPSTVRITVTGREGRNVEARLDVDGKVQKQVGVIPTEFMLPGGTVSFEVSGPDDEKIKVAMETDYGAGGFSEGPGFVRGGFIGSRFFGARRHTTWWGRHPEEPAQ